MQREFHAVGPEVSPTLARFSGEQSDRHPGLLAWPGVHGFPVIGNVPHAIKRSELIRRAVPVRYFYAKLFNLSEKEDSEYYAWVMDRVANGWFQVNHTDRRWDETGPFVYLEWYQTYFKIA